jgi:predicted aspartyl protease
MRVFFCATVAGFCLAFPGQSEPLHKIPFRFQDGLIWVKVQLAGTKEQLNYLLDSGASVTAIDLQTAQACRIRLGDPQSVEGVSGSSVALNVNDFQATAGGIPLPKSVLAIDLGAISNRCHRHIDGILGLDFFRDRILQIDFDSGMIGILKNCDQSLANCDILPIKIRNNAICLPVRIAGKSDQWMRLDTGCDSALEWAGTSTLTRGIVEPSFVPSGAKNQYIKTSVQLGRHAFSNVAVRVHADQIFAGENGLLGNGLLSKFCVTIDERNGRVIFEKVHGNSTITRGELQPVHPISARYTVGRFVGTLAVPAHP